jgi:ABC-type Fe3+ transport system substrate-binding protein
VRVAVGLALKEPPVLPAENAANAQHTLSSTLDVQQEGGKVALAGPTDDFLPVFFTAEAILKDAPHPNAAKLYVTWFLSKEWQTRTGVYSSRRDVPAPPGLLQQTADNRQVWHRCPIANYKRSIVKMLLSNVQKVVKASAQDGKHMGIGRFVTGIIGPSQLTRMDLAR